MPYNPYTQDANAFRTLAHKLGMNLKSYSHSGSVLPWNDFSAVAASCGPKNAAREIVVFHPPLTWLNEAAHSVIRKRRIRINRARKSGKTMRFVFILMPKRNQFLSAGIQIFKPNQENWLKRVFKTIFNDHSFPTRNREYIDCSQDCPFNHESFYSALKKALPAKTLKT